jgi:predicted nucleic acid-binding protein
VPVTLDASVWLASLSPTEPAHRASGAVLAALLTQKVPLHQPGLFVIEVCASIARRTRDRDLALDAGRALLAWPTLTMHELDHAMAAEATTLAATCALRGADAIYVATARRNGTVLVTLDEEMLERSAPAIDAISPADWLARYQAPRE